MFLATSLKEAEGFPVKTVLTEQNRVSLSGNNDQSLTAFISSQSPANLSYSKREDALHDRFWPKLKESHPCYLELKSILDALLQQAGLGTDTLSLSIFDSKYPDAHIQLLKRKVRISRLLLEILDGDAELIAAIIAHEIGHLMLAHYHLPSQKYEITEIIGMNYELEYQADRTSVILVNRMGIRPDSLAIALKKLDEYCNPNNEELQDINSFARRKSRMRQDDDDQITEDSTMWFLRSHPHAARRIMAIKRDADNLPTYPRILKLSEISVPTLNDFSQPVFRHWDFIGTLKNIYGNKFAFGEFNMIKGKTIYPDIIWKNIHPPSKIQPTPIDNKFYSSLGMKNAPDIDYLPAEVNTWTENDGIKIDKWWTQAIALNHDIDGHLDLCDDIEALKIDTIKLLLRHCNAEYFYLCLDGKEESTDLELEKYYLLDPTKEEYSSDSNLLFTTSILIEAWFKKDQTLNTLPGFRKICEFLRDFNMFHGTTLPYIGTRFFLIAEDLYQRSDIESQKKVIDLALEYEYELRSGCRNGSILARQTMPSVSKAVLDLNPGAYTTAKRLDNFIKTEEEIEKENIQGEEWEEYWKIINKKDEEIADAEQIRAMELEKKLASELRKSSNLPPAIFELFEAETVDPKLARKALMMIPKNFSTKETDDIVKTASAGEVMLRSQRGASDAELELDPHSSVNYLSTEEFEEKYFGQGRDEYHKANYADLDYYIQGAMEVRKLWNLAGFEANFDTMASGKEKLDFLLDSFRVKCAKRDILIVEALDWFKLRYVENLLATQNDIDKCSDIPLLFILREAFLNPFLNLSVSDKLWGLASADIDTFYQQVPDAEKQRAKEDLQIMPPETTSSHLETILICYKDPSYFRDELLRPLVDLAIDKATTLALANWYCEPPPGVIKPRPGNVVALSETMLDQLNRRNILERQELFIYFLGQRFFYSGIDTEFDHHLRAPITKARQKAVLTGEKDKHISQTYRVEKPDVLMFLIKSTGIPVDIFLQQQKLSTTKREQRDFIDNLLMGKCGLLKSKNKKKFMQAIAKNIVNNSSWSHDQKRSEKESIIDLLAFAMKNCPEHRLPDLFLGFWNLQKANDSLPDVIATLLRELGSAFIKAGQYLGTQSDSLPAEWIKVFRNLSDKNSKAEKTLVYEHEYAIYQDSSPFTRIGEKLGEGSMAAVYRATLKDEYRTNGNDIAIKIFHANILRDLDEDMLFLDKLVKFINDHKADFNIRLPDNLADVSKAQILKELSQANQRVNNLDITRVLKNSDAKICWRVPRIIENVSRGTFVVYDYSPGVALDELPSPISAEVKGEIAIELLRQILIEGVYQGDPNIGNFKVVLPKKKNEKIIVDWLDNDHVGRLEPSETALLRNFVLSIAMQKDSSKIAALMSELVDNNQKRTDLVIQIQRWLIDNEILDSSKIENLDEILIPFLDFLAEKKMILLPQYVVLLRALGLMKPLIKHAKKTSLMGLFTKLMFH